MTGDSVILQFSGYGFAKRGAPLWLLRELENRRKSIKTLGIFFHELYAFGPPWTSSFWLSPVQRHIARRLVELSDFWMTNQEASAQWLRRFAGGKPHAVLPVFSSMGEAPFFSPIRMRKIVVFGSAGLRQATYNTAGIALFSWARRESLEVHDIGPLIGDAGVSELLRGQQVVQHGHLEANEVSRLLKNSMFGIVAYPMHRVGKSSVFAAYCAHGVCPVGISQNHAQADGLVAGQHYLPGVPSESVEPAMAMSIGQAAWGWYQPHRVACHVEILNRLMNKQVV